MRPITLPLLLLLQPVATFALPGDAPGCKPRFSSRRLAAAPGASLMLRPRSRHIPPLLLSAAAAPAPKPDPPTTSHRAALLPIWLAVFVQMLGVGITLSQLPLHLMNFGASATQVGVTISCFSVAQMLGCPPLVAVSGRYGRFRVLRGCLCGAAMASALTALSTGWWGVTAARVLAGLFAASVPIAQAAVTDVVPPGPATSQALVNVASAASLGIITGPAVAGLVASVAGRFFGVPVTRQTSVVFGASSLLVLIVLAISYILPPSRLGGGAAAPALTTTATPAATPAASAASAASPAVAYRPFAQPLVRWIALVCSWTLTLGVGVYAFFAVRFLGYGQPAISATQSSAAAIALATQLLVLPRLLRALGEQRTCAVGLGALGLCFGAASLVRRQPLHAALYLSSRAGWAITDATNAALTAQASPPEKRASNLALLQSTQAGGRIVSPLLAGWLYETSLKEGGRLALGPPGALPFLAAGALALLTAPLPLLLLPRRQTTEAGQRQRVRE